MTALPQDPHDVTTLLQASQTGDDQATRVLLPFIYEELHRIARLHRMKERRDLTLSTTGLVHEAYLKLFDRSTTSPVDRRHFMALASRAIRQILVDHARSRMATKRGRNPARVALEPDMLREETQPEEVLALNDALTALENYDPDQARLVTLRYFGGMTMSEAAQELGLAKRSAERSWTRARAFLLAMMDDSIER